MAAPKATRATKDRMADKKAVPRHPSHPTGHVRHGKNSNRIYELPLPRILIRSWKFPPRRIECSYLYFAIRLFVCSIFYCSIVAAFLPSRMTPISNTQFPISIGIELTWTLDIPCWLLDIPSYGSLSRRMTGMTWVACNFLCVSRLI